ncbi:unnamed protein product [Dibothriocephalus latus]|uniref:Uncharacterized protein n=1 Tax=Dibothriocephalus latus TaxID=60516 RepID=A0A3P7NGL8_DIBLA|nr:unnamed protein product [Dibothriocephalus latus]
MRRPLLFEECGHSCCSKCFTDLMASTGRCPVDGAALERSKVTVDKQMQRELDHLGVKCNYFEQGCTWTGLASELSEHLEDCQCRLVSCIYDCGLEFEYGCTFRGKKKAIKAHLAEELLLHMLLMRDALHEFRNLLDMQVQAVQESQATVKKLQAKLRRSEAYFEPSFIWRIEGYRQKFEDAQQGKRTALFSQPFYSNNAYLKRPTSERNQCFGSPRFIELEQMNAREFVVDNTLYLKALFEIES